MPTIIRQLVKRQKFIFVFLVGVAVFIGYSLGEIADYFSPDTIAKPTVGSLALSDLNETLLNQSPELKREVTQALEEVGKDDVGCVAPIISSHSDSNLHNARIAPFICFFAANKSLVIQAENLAVLPDGEAIPIEQLLKQDNISERTFIQFNLISWQWKDGGS